MLDFAKPRRISAFLRHIVGDGLIILDEDKHKFVRKNTIPAFHARHIMDLYPTVPLTMREALRDSYIGEHIIPKGTEMVVSIWQINRSPDIWGPDASSFLPERSINADDGKPNRHGGAKSNYDFLTFLQGPRSCIGQEFAEAEMRCLLVALVTSFTWDLAMDESKIAPRGVITIKPEHGMYLRMKSLHHGS